MTWLIPLRTHLCILHICVLWVHLSIGRFVGRLVMRVFSYSSLSLFLHTFLRKWFYIYEYYTSFVTCHSWPKTMLDKEQCLSHNQKFVPITIHFQSRGFSFHYPFLSLFHQSFLMRRRRSSLSVGPSVRPADWQASRRTYWPNSMGLLGLIPS